MRTRDLRIESIRPLIAPAILLEEVPLSEPGSRIVTRAREEVSRILSGRDDRLLTVVGPCSIHDIDAALDYAQRLKSLSAQLKEDLCIVMRVYFEKPRTTVGWKGLINDPNLNGSFSVNEGLRRARRLLVELTEMGVPIGLEFLDPITPQFIADAVTWGAIGARTTESQVHRELASGLSMPVGFKNGTGGSIQLAVDAVYAARYPHVFLSVTEQGVAAIVTTQGNTDCHIILRGGKTGPNYGSEAVAHALATLEHAGLERRLMVDTSHGNSNKDYRNQPLVAREVGEQIAAGEQGIVGVLMESFIVEGRQDLVAGSGLVYGQSVTDACIGWEATVDVLHELAASVRTRRDAMQASAPPALSIAQP
jgi:3-deoxy-7-phosphoheptulonate synthase